MKFLVALRGGANHRVALRETLGLTPEEFDQIRDHGYEIGFTHVESAPLVRSSYHAARASENRK